MQSLSVLTKFFAIAFSALLPLINPLGSALVIIAVVGHAPREVYRDLARKIAVNTILFLLFFELVGATLLEFFGISLPVVQVAGGLVLAGMGWSLLNKSTPDTAAVESDLNPAHYKSLADKAFYPLTFPITAGPGCIVVTLAVTAHASSSVIVRDVVAHLGVMLAIVALSVLVYFCYSYAPKITSYVNPQTAHGILRVIAFVLLCIGVQITWNGVQAMIKIVMKG